MSGLVAICNPVNISCCDSSCLQNILMPLLLRILFKISAYNESISHLEKTVKMDIRELERRKCE